MHMRLHYFQHVPFEGLGTIEDWATQNGYDITVTRFFAGDTPPPVAEYDVLVVMGGPMGVYDDLPWLELEKRAVEEAIEANKYLLGVCLGSQIIAEALGGSVQKHKQKEIGWFPLEFTSDNILQRAIGGLNVFHWHGDTFTLPEGATLLASSAATPNQAFSKGDRILALQFHLESTQTGVRALVENCGAELKEGPFVLSKEELLCAGDYARLSAAMQAVLDQWL